MKKSLIERKSHTQNVVTAEAQQAFERLARDLKIPKSSILERILSTVPADSLIGLITGRLSFSSAKTVSLDAASTLAIRSEIASSLSLLGPRAVEAARLGARQGITDLIDRDQ
ncbi:hypothetical protein [Pseudomonas sp. MWU12-2037]|uniref:hypothetical protein n=1 Tax=Pseudomonas sp. MWU12-2037 TaxID=2928690 RepID=UPI00200DC07C|nr:hypothetical protein [Pseudomonas sp. MWU12-2037]